VPKLEEGNSEPATIAGVGFMTLDAEFRIGYLHSHGGGSQGMTSADVAGMSLWEAYPMAAGSLVEENLRAVMKERVARRFENYHEPWRSWFRIHALPAKDGGLAIYFEDISRQRVQEQLLGTAEHFSRAAAESSPDGIKIIDHEGKIVWVSSNGLAMMEWDRLEDIAGKLWIDQWPGAANREIARGALEAALAGKVGRFEACRTTAKGGVKWMNVAVVSMPGEGYRAEHVLSISRDVTSRRLLEDESRDSDQQFRDMADHAPVMIWIAGSDGRCNYLSKSWYLFSGRPPGGNEIAEWRAAVHPEDLAEVDALPRDSIGRISVAPLEYRARRADGQYRWLLDTVVPREGPGGRFAGCIGSMIDITDRKVAEGAVRQSETLFRNLANSIPQLAWMARADGEIFWFNQRWYDYIGEARGSAAGGNWAGFHGAEESAAVARAFNLAITSCRPFEEAFTLRRHDGEYRWHLCQMLPVQDDDGQLRLWFGTHTDITEEREAAWRKDRFLTTLAHELRNPLAPILTGLEVIRASASDPATIQRVAAMMKRATGQIVHLIDDLLDVTRINTGKFTLKKARVSLGEILGNAVESARADLQQQARRFEFTLGRDRIEVDGDPVRLEQVVSNLLSNAVKYTPRGGLIRLACGIDERSRPWISVSDSGPGIEPSRHEEIFKPFEQSECSSGGGLGIGLALVKVIVELHGGSIVVNSDGRGTGSEFIIRLPATDAVADPKEIVMPEMPMPTPSVIPRVLVVEDGKTTADILAMFFEVEGFEVSVAYDGVEALEKVAETMPDLILMDLGMPRMDGFEAARRIRSLPGGGEVTMVALSGWGREQDKQRSGAAGFDDHLVKPVSPADLRLLLTRFLKRSAKADH
jgi:PAS domain S-box-containing protein